MNSTNSFRLVSPQSVTVSPRFRLSLFTFVFYGSWTRLPTSGSIYGWAQRWRSTPTAVFHRRKSPGRDANTDIARALRRRLFASVTLGPIDSRYSETLAALFHSLLPYESLVKHALSIRSHVQTTIFARCCSTKANKVAEFRNLAIFYLSGDS